MFGGASGKQGSNWRDVKRASMVEQENAGWLWRVIFCITRAWWRVTTSSTIPSSIYQGSKMIFYIFLALPLHIGDRRAQDGAKKDSSQEKG